jgi:class 3 adenylate cyclase
LIGSQPPAASLSDSGVPFRTEIAAPDELDGERKMVTALFADIKGSMELMEDLDPEEARAIIDPALKLMIDAVRRYDGYVVQSTGDGIFALFGAPIAHEDHPQRALYSALRMHEAMRHYGERLRADKGLNLLLRIGVNLGEVIVRTIQTGSEQAEYSPIGHSTSLAARLQTLATPGSTVISGNMRALVEGYFQLKELGPTRIKGVSEPVELFEVIGLGPLRTRLQRAAGRGLTKFVGREREIEALRHAAGMAREGRGQIGTVMAEAGVGKSRLFHEFKARSQSGWMVLEAFSISHGKASPYLPVIELLYGYFGIDPKDDGRERREKVNGRIVTLDPALEDTRPYLFALLGLVESDDPLAQMDGEVKKRRTIDVIKRILLRESLNQPLMVIFEDLHWIDEQTQELLNLLADAIGTARILLLVNYRPEYHHLWGNKTYYTQLTLEPLGLESAQEMLDELLGLGQELSALKSLIIDRTEGNPFFMEEIVQGLFEQGQLVCNGDIKLTQPLASVPIPATVQAMLTARIDRLAPEDKALLQTLAVIGKEFTLSQVRAVLAGSNSELDKRLAALQSAEFIYEQPTAGDIEYTFKHALTQEVAYSSILTERRKQIHERAAQAIESLFAATLSDYYDDLAHHYSRSANALKAANYLRLAARQAMNRSAYTEAERQLNNALALLAEQPDSTERGRSEIAVLLSLATCTTLRASLGLGATAVVEMLERARALAERVGDEASLFEAVEPLARQYSIRDENHRAADLAQNLVAVATRIGDADIIGRALTCRGYLSYFDGRFAAALSDLDEAATLPVHVQPKRGTTLWFWRFENRAFTSLVQWVLGYPDLARAIIAELLVASRAPTELAFARLGATLLNVTLKDWKAVDSHAEEGIRLAHEHGLMMFLLLFGINRPWARAQMGHIEESVSEMLRLRADVFASSGKYYFFQGLANIYLLSGRQQEGLEAVDEALANVARRGLRFMEAEILRLKGELLLLGGNRSMEAADCFEDAIGLARQQSAKSWELRATISLARLLVQQDRRDEARTMLAEIYNWFTEGFDTADLKDAKALLDELSA